MGVHDPCEDDSDQYVDDCNGDTTSTSDIDITAGEITETGSTSDTTKSQDETAGATSTSESRITARETTSQDEHAGGTPGSSRLNREAKVFTPRKSAQVFIPRQPP